jgi:hypothetical protein
MARGGFDAGAAPKLPNRPRRILAYCGRKMVLTMGSTSDRSAFRRSCSHGAVTLNVSVFPIGDRLIGLCVHGVSPSPNLSISGGKSPICRHATGPRPFHHHRDPALRRHIADHDCHRYVRPASNVAGNLRIHLKETPCTPHCSCRGVYHPSSAYGHSPSNVRISVFDSCRRERKHGAAHRRRPARLHFLVRREGSHRPLVTHPRFAFRSSMRENVPVA